MQNQAPETEIEDEASQFKPLTRQEAQAWRERYPQRLTIWRFLWLQVGVGVVMSVAAGVLAGRASIGWSVAYGALAVVIPGAVFARGVTRRKASAGAAMAGFFVWELMKLALCIALLVAAPRLVPDLSWLALVAGLVVVMKTYWIALLVRPVVRTTD